MSRSVDELLHHWPTVASHAETEWAQGFARSILRQSRRPGWQPSPKQRALMERLVDELFIHRGDDDGGDLPVIDDGEMS